LQRPVWTALSSGVAADASVVSALMSESGKVSRFYLQDLLKKRNLCKAVQQKLSQALVYVLSTVKAFLLFQDES
jgi:hypothetical protein